MIRAIQCVAAMLACMGVWASGSPAQGGVVAMPPPGPARIAKADAVIVGKVVGIEPQDLKVGATTYRIAVVRIHDRLRGIKDDKTLRIGFIPIAKPDGKGPIVVVTGARPVQLDAGQEGLFILAKHPKESFYTFGGVVGYYVDSDKNKGFDQEVQAAKVAAKVVDNPQAALKAKDAGERLAAAAVLIEKYRTYRGPNSKQELIDADESKLILQALADADWQAPLNFTSLRPSPLQLFQRLGVSKADGFTPPPGGNQVAVQTWVREHAQKYRIQRFVAAEK